MLLHWTLLFPPPPTIVGQHTRENLMFSQIRPAEELCLFGDTVDT